MIGRSGIEYGTTVSQSGAQSLSHHSSLRITYEISPPQVPTELLTRVPIPDRSRHSDCKKFIPLIELMNKQCVSVSAYGTSERSV